MELLGFGRRQKRGKVLSKVAVGVRQALGESPTRLYCPKYRQQRSPQNRAGARERISALLFEMVFPGFPGTYLPI